MALSRVGDSLVDLDTVVRVLDLDDAPLGTREDAVRVTFSDSTTVDYYGKAAKSWRELVGQVPAGKSFSQQRAS